MASSVALAHQRHGFFEWRFLKAAFSTPRSFSPYRKPDASTAANLSY